MLPDDEEHALLALIMRERNWSMVSMDKLLSIKAILNDMAVPVARMAPDGTPAEACVVCGDLLFPRPQPRCEDCPDPEDVPEGYELHIVFPPA